jgi:hypothetical protein
MRGRLHLRVMLGKGRIDRSLSLEKRKEEKKHYDWLSLGKENKMWLCLVSYSRK